MPSIQEIEFLLESAVELTEAQLEYLVENRIEFIKTANKDKISTDHDPEASKLSSDKIVDHIARKIDPTDRKEHTQWLVNRYKAGDFKLDDHKEIKKTMNAFLNVKPHLESGDLGQYKSIGHLKDAVATQRTKLDLIAKKTKEAAEDKVGATGAIEMPEVFRSGDNVGYKIPSRQASIKNYGPNGKLEKTNWCTAADSRNNMFSGYSGGKYTLHLDNGHVMQIHHGSNQFMDKQDRPVDIKDPRFKNHADVISDFVKKTGELEGDTESRLYKQYVPQHSGSTSELLDAHEAALKKFQETDSYSDSKKVKDTFNAISDHLEHAKLSDSEFDRLGSLQKIRGWGSDTEPGHAYAFLSYAKNPNANPDHLDKIVDHPVIAEEPHLLPNVAANANVSEQTLHKIIGKALANNDHGNIHKIMHTGQNLTEEHYDRVKHIPGVAKFAIENKNAKLPEDAFDDPNVNESRLDEMAAHPSIPDRVAKDLFSEAGQSTKRELIANPSVKKQTIKDAIDAGQLKANGQKGYANGYDLKKILDRDDYDSPEDVDHLMNAVIDKKVTPSGNQYLTSSKLSREHVKNIISHPDAFDHVDTRAYSITGNPRFRPDDFKTLIDHPRAQDNIDKVGSAMQSANELNPKVIDNAISKFGDRKELVNVITEENHADMTKPNHLHYILNSKHANTATKHWVLRHPAAQMSHFETMKDDVRNHGAISGSKNAPPSILHSLATSPLDHVRANVANNPNTEARTLEILKADQNPEIAKVAAKKAK